MRNDPIRWHTVLDPLHKRIQCEPSYNIRTTRAWGQRVAFDGVRPGAATAVPHPRQQEQPGEFLGATQSSFPLSPIVPAVTSLAGNQSFVIVNGVQCWRSRISKAVSEDKLAAV